MGKEKEDSQIVKFTQVTNSINNTVLTRVISQ